MLRDWSDRPPEPPRRPFLASIEFWVGFAATPIGLALLAPLAGLIW